jgi:enoyl-CoA hydratase/carnithine racemase
VHALYCDLRFAADNTVFTTAFSRRGLIAEHGINGMLPRIVGHAPCARSPDVRAPGPKR